MNTETNTEQPATLDAERYAKGYHEKFVTEPDKATDVENRALIELIKPRLKQGDTLEIACGTGFSHYYGLFDSAAHRANLYHGVDVLEEAIEKLLQFNHYNNVRTYVLEKDIRKRLPQVAGLDILMNRPVMNLICLYSGQYLSDAEVLLYQKLLAPGGRMIFMFIQPDEPSLEHRYWSGLPKGKRRKLRDIKALFPLGCEIERFYRYFIVTATKPTHAVPNKYV